MKRVPFLIAEAGVNHNGDPRLAVRLVDAAADAGADAVKFQTFKAENLAIESAPKAKYQLAGAPEGSQLAMLRKLELSEAGHREALKRAKKRGIEFLSTPFDEPSADFLHRLGVARFKLGSGELTNLPLLRHVARLKRPMILSTGMSTLAEVRDAVKAVKGAGNPPLSLLHCVSCYPADPADANLRAMKTLADAFRVPVGFSDHTPGLEVSVAAAALGAEIVEKHFTLDKNLPGPDHAMSLDPAELAAWVRAVRNARAALGDGVKSPRPAEEEIRRVARRSIVLSRGLPAGARLHLEHLALKRPGTGMPPSELDRVVGRALKRSLPADTLLQKEMLK
ncbi:MAG: N-acetylneuraminate synthase [Elusimicrobia bacterium]|nr:N-acetylneuraminate synthase [Elusimicrobiota bacterium]